MDDARVGAALRAVRVRRGWRQLDVASKARVSRALISLIERGHISSVSVGTLRAVGAVLDVRIDVGARWRGGELDRLLNSRHAALGEAFTRWLRSLGWEVAPEVSFAIGVERGWIDLLAWHAPSRTLLVIELKTEIVDLQNTIGVLDRKRRLAPRIAAARGWKPLHVATLLVVGEGPSNRRRVSAHRSLLHAAYPADGRLIKSWLRSPLGTLAGLLFFSDASPGSAKSGFSSQKRVRPRSTSTRASSQACAAAGSDHGPGGNARKAAPGSE